MSAAICASRADAPAVSIPELRIENHARRRVEHRQRPRAGAARSTRRTRARSRRRRARRAASASCARRDRASAGRATRATRDRAARRSGARPSSVCRCTIIGRPAASEIARRSSASSVSGMSGSSRGGGEERCCTRARAAAISSRCRSYASFDVAPNVKSPWFSKTIPTVAPPACPGQRRRTSRASSKPGITYGITTTRCAEDFAHERLAVRDVRQRHDRVGVRVQHRRIRQEGVEQRLDRGLRRERVEPRGGELAGHLRVAEHLELEQLAQPLEPQRRKALARRSSPCRGRSPSRRSRRRRGPSRRATPSSPTSCRRRAARATGRRPGGGSPAPAARRPRRPSPSSAYCDRVTRTIDWVDGAVELIDQTRLPDELVVLRIDDVPRLVDAIKRLAVRGAPAIGVAGAFGVVLAREEPDFAAAVDSLRGARPTAVNLARMVDRVAARPGRRQCSPRRSRSATRRSPRRTRWASSERRSCASSSATTESAR